MIVYEGMVIDLIFDSTIKYVFSRFIEQSRFSIIARMLDIEFSTVSNLLKMSNVVRVYSMFLCGVIIYIVLGICKQNLLFTYFNSPFLENVARIIDNVNYVA